MTEKRSYSFAVRIGKILTAFMWAVAVERRHKENYFGALQLLWRISKHRQLRMIEHVLYANLLLHLLQFKWATGLALDCIGRLRHAEGDQSRYFEYYLILMLHNLHSLPIDRQQFRLAADKLDVSEFTRNLLPI